MPSYKVKWEIEVDAQDAYQAAEMALDIQRDGESTALVFKVKRQGRNKTGKGHPTYVIDFQQKQTHEEEA